MGNRHLLAASASLCAALLPAPAGAAPLVARYEVTAGGLTIMQFDASFDLDGPRYAIRIQSRMRGMAGWFASGEQVTSAEGRWEGNHPIPGRYRQEGTWRGKRRVVAIDYTPAGMPQLRAIEPPNDGEREAVPAALQQDTMDGLSALAKLVRSVARTGRCDTTAAVFDGRRRSNYSVRTVSQDILPASGGYAGPALRCAFESRILAGFLLSQDREAEAKIPHPATAWLGEPWPGAGPVPVLIELPTRWFGAVRAVLVSVGPDGSGRSVAQGSAGQQGR
ncbi:MAG: DUF3108 domain-containing protein [Acetobacteraceae bacterium]|nr:MAG: DUF3108 domain-containing protein [Acetobacteraceae bacterium]